MKKKWQKQMKKQLIKQKMFLLFADSTDLSILDEFKNMIQAEINNKSQIVI